MTTRTFVRQFVDGSTQQIIIEFDSDVETDIPFAAKVTYGPRVPADIEPTPLVRDCPKPKWVGASEPAHDGWVDTVILLVCAAILTTLFYWVLYVPFTEELPSCVTSTGIVESSTIPICKMDVE
ncbi:membrane protein [Rhodobacter phage RcKickapoo]|nr:membrane protein [Rhodobacter phage RcKickapoo]